MDKILIVDDEILVRTNIKMLIDWDNGSYSLCGEASNGLEAIELIRNENPHIVITDMKMPVMDGLTLSEKIREDFPGTAVIALSNYDDYDYVRGALNDGAVDYILKHSLNRQILSEVLQKAKKQYESGDLNNINKLGKANENNVSLIKGKFLVQLLTGLYTDLCEIESHLSLLDIHLGKKNIVPIVMTAADDSSVDKSLKKRDHLEYGILNITKEIAEQY